MSNLNGIFDDITENVVYPTNTVTITWTDSEATSANNKINNGCGAITWTMDDQSGGPINNGIFIFDPAVSSLTFDATSANAGSHLLQVLFNYDSHAASSGFWHYPTSQSVQLVPSW